MVAASSSCPQFNIKDVNNALITLLQNPDCDFDEIYCAPDFATGAILLNADEVKESTFVGSIVVKSSKPIMKYIIGSSTLVAFSLGLLFLIIFNFIKSIIML